MANNLVEYIGKPITVWTPDGNSMERRELITIDTHGIVVSAYKNRRGPHDVFVPWQRVMYIDLPLPEVEFKVADSHAPNYTLLGQIEGSKKAEGSYNGHPGSMMSTNDMVKRDQYRD